MKFSLRLIRISLMILLTLAAFVSQVQAGPEPLIPIRKGKPPIQNNISNWTNAEHVFVGILNKVVVGPVSQSDPPIFNDRLYFTVNTVLRGNITVGSQIESTRSVKQQEAPKHPVRKKCLVAASGPLKQLRITMIEEATEARIAEISLACSLPLGWKIEQGKPLSPWASISKETWPANKNLSADHSCRVTQRPALLAGSALEFRVKSVPPKKEIKWTNPDGDGEYKITVTNTTDKPLPVPALLSRNKKVLWEESLVILCQGKTYTCPGCKSDWQSVTPTELAPKESLSTVVQVLRLKGPEWPRGGYRIEFQFCLGEKSQTKSLYYMSRHHDAIRNGLR